ncbi:MAG: AMP-binding protein [Akkermansiaceae bacterium]
MEEFRGPQFWEECAPHSFDDYPGLAEWAQKQKLLANHVLFRSSGSAGALKWIALSKSALRWSAEAVIRHLEISASDIYALCLPVHHVGGFGVVARCEFSGARLAHFPQAWSPVAFCDFCEAEKITLTSLVPTQVADLVSAGLSAPNSFRSIVVGGGHLNLELTAQARALGWPVQPSFGMTETASQIATGDNLPLIEGWEVRLNNELLEVRGGGLLTGYITREDDDFCFCDPKVRGWFLTSDRVNLDGWNMIFAGRADRCVKVLGELVDLDALEGFWAKHTGSEVVVIARPNDRRMHTLHLIYTGNGSEIERLNSQLSGPERIQSWKELAALPRGPLGKINRLSMNQIQFD